LFDSWLVPVAAVGALGLLTLGFALLIGKWIDAQSNSVVDEPKRERRGRNGKGNQSGN